MPDDAESLIQLNGIDRTFTLGDSQVHALRNVNLNINRGEYIAVMGPSGSGKSTLLNLIGLLDRADTGTYQLEGRDVTTLDPNEQAKVRSERIGFIFQSFHLVPRLTAAANIELPLTLSGMPAAEPVSYTHLDVYKRQPLSSPMEEEPLKLVKSSRPTGLL